MEENSKQSENRQHLIDDLKSVGGTVRLASNHSISGKLVDAHVYTDRREDHTKYIVLPTIEYNGKKYREPKDCVLQMLRDARRADSSSSSSSTTVTLDRKPALQFLEWQIQSNWIKFEDILTSRVRQGIDVCQKIKSAAAKAAGSGAASPSAAPDSAVTAGSPAASEQSRKRLHSESSKNTGEEGNAAQPAASDPTGKPGAGAADFVDKAAGNGNGSDDAISAEPIAKKSKLDSSYNTTSIATSDKDKGADEPAVTSGAHKPEIDTKQLGESIDATVRAVALAHKKENEKLKKVNRELTEKNEALEQQNSKLNAELVALRAEVKRINDSYETLKVLCGTSNINEQ